MIYSKNKYNTLGIVMNSFCLFIFIFFTYVYRSVYIHNILIKFIANSQGNIKLRVPTYIRIKSFFMVFIF